MSAMPYHKRYHGDALTGFMALSLEERGAYQTVLDLIYDHGGPIADNERLLAGYMNCSLRKWRTIRDELIAKRKIRIDREGRITNARAEKELENSAKTSRKLSESGAKGGRTRAENREKGNDINETDQASLEAGLSPAQAISEARVREEGTEAKASGVPPAKNPVKAVFDLGVEVLTAAGRPGPEARSLVGKWRKSLGDAPLAELLLLAREKTDPVEWLEKAVDRRGGQADDYVDRVDRKYGT